MYVKITLGIAAIYTLGQLRTDNNGTSFPSVIPEALLADYDVYVAAETAPPTIDSAYQTTTYGFINIASVWTQQWSIVGNGVTDEDLKYIRYIENQDYADSLADAAKLTPESGVTYDQRQVDKANRKRINGGQSNKTVKVSDADDYLFDWVDTVYDSQDLADDVVEAANRATLESYDAATAVVWPSWTPYTV